MVECSVCDREMKRADSCDRDDELEFAEGETLQPIPFGSKGGLHGEDIDPEARCGDCNVAPGGVHHVGCDMERCPRCGGQYFICDCVTEEKREYWSDRL